MSRFRDKAMRRAVGRALHDYNMVSEGDRIAVGLSGGKDSLALMWALQERLPRIPIEYTVQAIYIDLGFEQSPAPLIEDYCAKQGYPLRVEYTDYGLRGHSKENRENPCFLCARLRRKRLFELTNELGCNKLALGHNMDDVIETLFLNMCYAGQIATMVPCQAFFNGKLVVIRPLAYVDEGRIVAFARDHRLPEIANPCPTAKRSKRSQIKAMLHGLYQTNAKIRGNIFRSMHRVNQDYLLRPVPAGAPRTQKGATERSP